MHTNDNKLLEEIGELLTLHYEDWQVQDHKGAELAFGRYLRALRNVHGWTIAEVAEQANMAESELLAYERGLIPKRWIQERSLSALAKTLGEEIDNFLLLLEADKVTETVPNPPAPSAGYFEPHKPDQTSGYVAGYTGKNRFWNKLIFAHKAKAPMLSSGKQVEVRTKLSLRRGTPYESGDLHLPGKGVTRLVAKMNLWSFPSKLIAKIWDTPLRRVLGDPQWQVKIYRIWTPVVTLLLFFCLQLQAFHTPSTRQADPKSSLAAVIKVGAEEQVPSLYPFLPFVDLPYAYVMPRVATFQDKVSVKLLENGLIQPAGASQEPSSQPELEEAKTSVNVKFQLTQPESRYEVQTSIDTLLQQRANEKWQTLTVNLPMENPPSPIVHTVDGGEGLACIANYYFKREDFYPLLCLYNFGSLKCSGSLQPEDQVKIPVFEDFQRADPQLNQALTDVSDSVLDSFKIISRETLHANQLERLRGIDYFCEPNDYKNYGEKWVLAGKVDPARIPIRSESKG